MNKEDIKKAKEKLNSRFGTRSFERVQIAQEYLAEMITKEVDNCPIQELKVGVLMEALDDALSNLEIDKDIFIDAWSAKTVKDDIETIGNLLKKFSENGITKITGLAAGLTCILEKTFDKDLIKVVIKLMNRYYNEEDN